VTKTLSIDGLKSRIASFGRREEGSVAMIFGLTAIPFFLMGALSIDYSMRSHMDVKFSAGVDNATLAAAKMVKDGVLSDAEIEARALAYFKESINGHYATFSDSDFKIKVDRNNSRIDIDVDASVPTIFGRIAGYEKMLIPQKASAVFQLRDIEVGLALDITGSMNGNVSGGKTKLDALKGAFETFADLMLPDKMTPGQKVRIGLAPYSSGVNLGTYAAAATDNRSTDGCVTERDAAQPYSDSAPSKNNYFHIGPDNRNDIDPTENLVNNVYVCPTAGVTPLTSDRKALVDAVKSYDANGYTAGHLGAQWAWNLVSPNWANTWQGNSRPDAYGKKNLIKAVILMTDGTFNTAYHHDDSSVQAIKMCDQMKANGIQVFSLAFAATPAAKKTLEACATSGKDYFVDATDQKDLDNAFAKFAGKINALRLSQ
jgi:Flp pilus assembly protein TadG